jgi:glycerol-3-phosphate acyltransferase PlsY
MTIIYLCIFAYLLGSVPFGLVFARLFTKQDLRRIGSGNIGATNALRAGGWRLGLATLAGDVSKGAIPVFLALFLHPGNEPGGPDLWMALAATCAFFGHLFPVYLRFSTGGKGVATAAGCFAIMSPVAIVISLGAFLAVAGVSRRVSAGSLAAAALLPVAVFWVNGSLILSGCALVISMMIIFRHRDNILRLLAGTEPKIGRLTAEEKQKGRSDQCPETGQKTG